MATSPFDVVVANNLETISFVAGDKQIYTFDVYTSACVAVNLTGATTKWTLSDYGNPLSVRLVKDGVLAGDPTNRFIVTLTKDDTVALEGVFIQQPSIVDISGSSFHPGQGEVYITAFASTS